MGSSSPCQAVGSLFGFFFLFPVCFLLLSYFLISGFGGFTLSSYLHSYQIMNISPGSFYMRKTALSSLLL